MRGPMGKPKNRVENPGKLLKRLMDYIFRDYKFHCIIVFILIFVGVIANVQGTMFTRDLIDKYITPFLLSSDTPNFTPLAHAIGKVACFYGVGIVATYTYNRIMIYNCQCIYQYADLEYSTDSSDDGYGCDHDLGNKESCRTEWKIFP